MSCPLEVKIDEVLEQNQDLKQVRKSGKVGISASKISKFNLDEDELSVRFRNSPNIYRIICLERMH